MSASCFSFWGDFLSGFAPEHNWGLLFSDPLGYNPHMKISGAANGGQICRDCAERYRRNRKRWALSTSL